MDSEKAGRTRDACADKQSQQVTGEVGRLVGHCYNNAIKSDKGWEPIHFACDMEDPAALEFLLAKYPAVGVTPTPDGLRPLMIAARKGNLEAVKLLLNFLTINEIKLRTPEGMNCLDYVISSEVPHATDVALVLLKKCSQYDFITIFPEIIQQSFLQQLVLKRNSILLGELLAINNRLAINDPPGQGCISIHLIRYCIQHNWPIGLQTSIDNYNLWCTGKPTDHHIDSFLEDVLLDGDKLCNLSIDGANRRLYSLWAFCFYEGLFDIIKILLKRGLTLQHMCIVYLNEKVEVKRKLTYFPLALALGDNIIVRMAFLVDLVRMQPAEDFDMTLLKSCRQMRWTGHELQQSIHPLKALIVAFVTYQNRYGISYPSAVEFLHSLGFTFNFRSIPVLRPKFNVVEWYDTLTYLLMYFRRDKDPGCRLLLSCMLECDHKYLQVTPATIFALTLVGYESKLPREISNSIWGQLMTGSLKTTNYDIEVLKIVAEIDELLYTAKVTSFNVDNRKLWHTTNCKPKQIIRLLMKGVPIYAPRLHEKFYSSIPVALFFCEIEIKDAFTDTDDHMVFGYKISTPPVNTLKYLCRTVIREVIGASRLVKEPVPRRMIPATLDQFTFEDRESSAIDKLQIPYELKQYLMYIDNFNDYCLHVQRAREVVN